MNLQFPKILRPLLGKKLIWQKKSPSSKVIYLTFDDGPVPEVTPMVLDILDEYGVKATFFCVGENVKKYPEIYNEILARGHRTGNHTFNHLKGFKTDNDTYIENVRKAKEYIDSNLFRPPHGLIKRKQVKALSQDYQIVMWDVISYDYKHFLLPEEIFNIVKKKTNNGSIIVFHDSIKAKNNMLSALPKTIEFLNSEKYCFELL